jgi:hypothetical protein
MIRTESIKQQRFAHRLFCGAGQPTRPIRDSLNAPPNQSEGQTSPPPSCRRKRRNRPSARDEGNPGYLASPPCGAASAGLDHGSVRHKRPHHIPRLLGIKRSGRDHEELTSGIVPRYHLCGQARIFESLGSLVARPSPSNRATEGSCRTLVSCRRPRRRLLHRPGLRARRTLRSSWRCLHWRRHRFGDIGRRLLRQCPYGCWPGDQRLP